ncbi:hypothetical protein PTKIN_Ptkin01aG0345500 [Pterospermum kingtungense]
MACGGISSVNSEKISHRFTRALSSAFFEWMLLFMLFIDAIVSYLITKFAHKCKLQTPCLLCSRLDHVFGKEKLKFYWDLVCGEHKLEISSLVYCHAHNKLVDVHGMCESCLFSFATINKTNAETYRLLVGKLGEDFDCGPDENPSLENHKLGHSTIRYCSCCNEPCMPKGYRLIQTRSNLAQAAEFDLPLPVSVENGQDDHKRSDNVSISDKARRKNVPDPLSHVAYTELKITSDSESEVSIDSGDEEDALIIENDHLQRDIVDQHVQPEPRTITLSDDFASEKLIDPISALKTSVFISESRSDVIEPLGCKSVEPTDSSGHGLEELNWDQVSSKIQPSAFPELISHDDDPVSSKAGEASIDVSPEFNLNSLDKVPPMSYADEIPIQQSEDSKLISIDDVSALNVGSSSAEESKETSVMSTLEVEKKSVTECKEICNSTKESLPIPESPTEKNHVVSDIGRKEPPTEESLPIPESPTEKNHVVSDIGRKEPPTEESLPIPESPTEKNHVVSDIGRKEPPTEESLPIPESPTEKNHVVSDIGGKEPRTEESLPIPESPTEKNHVVSDTSIQAPNLLDLSDAYTLAVGSKGRQLSGLLVEQWIGKDSSRLSEDLRVLLSQLSAVREQSMSDVSPRVAVSPRVSINSDELKASDSSTFNGMQILQKRISLERNESGLSIDGSIVSEIEGESVVDRLKRQVEHDRKLLSALYKEVEEERNASAVAANQAMAMITRLQEEKAALQMEALQNLRMMEEQAEYDMEALQQTNDLLAEKEKEIQNLEAELEYYRMKFPNESMLDDIMKSAYDSKARHGTVDHSEANGIEEKASMHLTPVSEKPKISSKVEETDQSCIDTNKGAMENPSSGYEQGYHEEFIARGFMCKHYKDA